MKSDFSKFAFWAAAAAGAACVIVLAMLTFQSLFRLFGPQSESEKVAPAETAVLPALENDRSVPSEASGLGDAPERASPGQGIKPAADDEFCTDSEMIRQKEQERRGKTDNLRLAGKNADSNAVLPEEKLKQPEKARDI